jgi:Zn-dependent protease
LVVADKKRAYCPACDVVYHEVNDPAVRVTDYAPSARSGTVEVAETASSAAGLLDEVRTEVAAQEATRHRPWANLGWLLLSVVIFFSLASIQNAPAFVVSVVVILFIHEMGHLLAMKFWGYKDVKMLFLPMLGAAVSGRPGEVDGTRKALVSLFGPAPGILLGIATLFFAVGLHSEPLWMAGVLALFINTFNLLPLHPLDGSRILQHTLFNRAPRARVIFQGITVLVLIGLAVAFKWWFIGIFAFLLALRLPVSWASARAAEHLKRTLGSDRPDLPYDIPEKELAEIVAFLEDNAPDAVQKPKILAQMSREVWDTVRSRPPAVSGAVTVLVSYLVVFGTGLVVLIGLMTRN